MVLLDFNFSDLLQPQWYISNGGIWFILFVVFAETGLLAGFFLPGDSLLFVAGIYSKELVSDYFKFGFHFALVDLLVLVSLISLAGIIGNSLGYWFGKKSGPFLFERKDTFFFKKKYLFQAKEFYDKNGGKALIMARFLPIVRTFAPVVAGIVKMEYKKFTFFNIVGSITWVFTMIFAGHYLQTWVKDYFHFDLKAHLEVIVIGIVLVTTLPVIYKMVFHKKKAKK